MFQSRMVIDDDFIDMFSREGFLDLFNNSIDFRTSNKDINLFIEKGR